MAGSVNYPVPGATSGVIFASASRAAAAYNSDELFNGSARGVRLFLNATIAGGATLDVKIQNFDPASQAWRDIPLATATQITATGSATLTVYPGALAAAGVVANTALGLRWRVVATVGTATAPFSIGADYLV